MKREFAKHIDSLQSVFDFLSEYIHSRGLPDESLPGLHLAVEEVFVNLVRYNTDSQNDILVELANDGRKLTICLQDRDVQPYDITQHKDVDTKMTLEQRRPGGLGIHFVKQIMDDVQYDYSNRTSTIRMTKQLED